jgi:hypothetical protein
MKYMPYYSHVLNHRPQRASGEEQRLFQGVSHIVSVDKLQTYMTYPYSLLNDCPERASGCELQMKGRLRLRRQLVAVKFQVERVATSL